MVPLHFPKSNQKINQPRLNTAYISKTLNKILLSFIKKRAYCIFLIKSDNKLFKEDHVGKQL